MRSLPYRLLLLFPLLFTLAAGHAAAQPTASAPSFVPEPPKINAGGFILQDFQSGRVLAARNEDERMDPASLTKMMTAYVVLHELANGAVSLGDSVRVSEKAWRMTGSRMFIEVGTQVSLEELLKGMIVQSGNDASVALAEFVAGSEDAFAALMNQHGQMLGLTGTHFTNATGLPNPNHYTTPRDMAHLAAALIRDFPEHYAWYSIRKYTYNNIPQWNRNKLLWRDETVDGVKTGHTEAAGYCLVASASRENMRLISVVMGTKSEDSRADESQKLLNWGFRFYETHKLYGAGEALKEMRVWKGAEQTVSLGLGQELFVTVPRGRYEALNASMTVDSTLIAPLRKGETIGNVAVKLEDETIAEQPLVALEDVAEGGLWQKLKDNVILWFE